MQIRGIEALEYLGLGVSASLLRGKLRCSSSSARSANSQDFPHVQRYFAPCRRLFIANGNDDRDKVHSKSKLSEIPTLVALNRTHTRVLTKSFHINDLFKNQCGI